MTDAPAYIRLHATGLTMLTEKYGRSRGSAITTGLTMQTEKEYRVYVFSTHLQYAHASVLLYTFMREIQKCGNVILGTRWN